MNLKRFITIIRSSQQVIQGSGHFDGLWYLPRSLRGWLCRRLICDGRCSLLMANQVWEASVGDQQSPLNVRALLQRYPIHEGRGPCHRVLHCRQRI